MTALHRILPMTLLLVAAACATSTPTRTYSARVEGMTCGESCPVEVKEALESIPGVRSATVDYPTQTAVVVVDSDKELTTREMDLSFQNKGYFISSIEERAQ
ncbi:MAG TPA: cation transporter [Candidatus Binatia bacterium]|nr:cation transporter [Candidatus Binatia bacterium]